MGIEAWHESELARYRLVLSGELAKHAVSEGTKVVTKLTNAQVALTKNASFRDRLSVMVRAKKVSAESSSVYSEVVAESKKGFISVIDKKDGYMFYYPFGWQVAETLIKKVLAPSNQTTKLI